MLKIDLHIHTIASGHAYNTILEYINQAASLKMKVIGISDHGPKLIGTGTNESYFRVLKRVPEHINGVRVLKGIEANIIDTKGSIDIDDIIIEKLDYVMAGMHQDTQYKSKGAVGDTRTMIRAIESGKINIITHPSLDQRFPFDVAKIAEAACANDVLLELNVSLLADRKLKHNTITNMKTLVDAAKKHNRKLIVNTDSHSIWELADDSALNRIKKEIGLTEKLIINNYPKELFSYLGLQP
jgi:putative hydrolase